MAQQHVLVTGVTGYVGGRLVTRLCEAGYRVRALVRDPNRLQGYPWYDQVEVAQGDVLQAESLVDAMQGIDVAYYLIHSLGGAGDFAGRDIRAAHNFSVAAAQAGVKRIIYLGGLGDPASDLSPHLRSRQHTGEVLRSTIVPVTELRAAVIVGSGSISFEMIRYLTERLPIMICPRWVYTRIQPIAIRNVLDYLVACMETPTSAGQIIEIGGANVLTYAEMMQIYAEVRGLKRILLPVPVLTPTLSAYWVHWVTPISARIAHPLIEGLRNEVVVRNDQAQLLFPQIQPMGYRQAVELALQKLSAKQVETSWSDALASSHGDEAPFLLTNHEGMILERRQVNTEATPDALYRAFSSLGGSQGWLAFNWA